VPGDGSVSRLKLTFAIPLLAVVYIAAARFGLGLEPVSGFATLVWAPTGISIAALLLFGVGLAPGVAIGAFAANALAGAPAGVAAGIAAGNTAEALFATLLLQRIGFQRDLGRVRDVFALIATSVVSAVVSATVGVASLGAGEVMPRGAAGATWRAWWVGDTIGALIVTPLLLAWFAWPVFPLPHGRRLAEIAMLGLVTVVSAALVFLQPLPWLPDAFRQAYLCYPALIWAALRFGPRGAATTALLISVVAIWGTAQGGGPFAAPLLSDRLLSLQTFMAVAAATFLLLGAASAERAAVTRDLERALREARTAREAADAANRTKSDFLAAMSHELRTPLNAIGGYVDLLQLGIRGPVSDEQKADLERIRVNQQHLLGLIGGVLDLSRIEAGKVSYQLRDVPVALHLAALEALVGPQVAARQQRLICHPCPGELVVRADEEKLRQILLNLLSNAIRYAPPGSEIGIRAERRAEDAVEIIVSDTGPGIPEEHHETIFEPFVQLDRDLVKSDGVGLGLAVSRDLARGMGGDLYVVKGTARGATFALSLPSA
jgi:signal transduction histidine kinase